MWASDLAEAKAGAYTLGECKKLKNEENKTGRFKSRMGHGTSLGGGEGV